MGNPVQVKLVIFETLLGLEIPTPIKELTKPPMVDNANYHNFEVNYDQPRRLSLSTLDLS